MGTLVFLALRFFFHYDTFGDAQTLSTVVSLDTISLILLLMLLRNKKS
jgi:hypothetical protein